jgi:hypothetical protein
VCSRWARSLRAYKGKKKRKEWRVIERSERELKWEKEKGIEKREETYDE